MHTTKTTRITLTKRDLIEALVAAGHVVPGTADVTVIIPGRSRGPGTITLSPPTKHSCHDATFEIAFTKTE